MKDSVIVASGHNSLTALCRTSVRKSHGGMGVVAVSDCEPKNKRPAGVSLAGMFGLNKKNEIETDEPQRG